jgi:acetoin utilization deacetylase AcuC-like enzyme
MLGTLWFMSIEPRVAVVSHESSISHVSPRGHPESAARMYAVEAALEDPALSGRLTLVSARAATVDELALAHEPRHIERVHSAVESGMGQLDADTFLSPGSWNAAIHAAGAGLTAIETLEANQQLEGAFVAVRPPGHHATADTSMGFCLFNSIAISAAHLADRGERVLIVDWDVHHGNGTQAIFWNDPRVSFVSLHEANNYPYSGRIHERGGVDAQGSTTNFAMPSRATGDVYRKAVDEVIEGQAATFEPTWILVSAGFDAHYRDPISQMDLTAGDYASLTRRLRALAPGPARTVLFLEGGYDQEGLRRSVLSTVATLAGIEVEAEQESSGGPGAAVVEEVAAAVG